jgi:hypothetical protein
MNVEKDKKIELTLAHEMFVDRYNKFLELVMKNIEAKVDEISYEDLLKILEKVKMESKYVRMHIEEMDRMLTDNGLYHRIYYVSDKVRKEAASRPISD